ncbi:MAG: V-type ATP synthase subunit D [Candidatus Methanofastidiosia archaeon]
MTTEINPTRSELLELKKKIELSQSGHALLKKKRDALILELFSAIKKAKNAREKLDREYEIAQEKIAISQAIDGIVKLKSVAFARTDSPYLTVKKQNIMGIEIPHISEVKAEKKIFERGYGIGSTSSRIDEACLFYEKIIEKIAIAAEFETIIKKILYEIEKTKRRVNALEYRIIPDLLENQKIIVTRLNERERENIFILKKVKKGIKRT